MIGFQSSLKQRAEKIHHIPVKSPEICIFQRDIIFIDQNDRFLPHDLIHTLAEQIQRISDALLLLPLRDPDVLFILS